MITLNCFQNRFSCDLQAAVVTIKSFITSKKLPKSQEWKKTPSSFLKQKCLLQFFFLLKLLKAWTKARDVLGSKSKKKSCLSLVLVLRILALKHVFYNTHTNLGFFSDLLAIFFLEKVQKFLYTNSFSNRWIFDLLLFSFG